jgi:hypothetical protein
MQKSRVLMMRPMDESVIGKITSYISRYSDVNDCSEEAMSDASGHYPPRFPVELRR